ncbi:MAG: RloB domain-containing protein [Fibrobacter sp.]|nr:RloB domain-containing protein [Fibrobacter sp.]
MKKLSLEEIAQEEQLHAQRIEQESQPKERFVKLTFLIATEGTQTEPNYFNALKAELDKSNRFNINITVQGKGKSTTALVNKVHRQIEYNHQEYDRVWVVFDRDEFPDFDEAIQLAAEHKINCAWSNESFELWLLLHFKDVSERTSRKDLCDLLEEAIRNELHKTDPNALYDYSKGNIKIYEHATTLGNEAKAFSRAEALRNNFKGSANAPSMQNPCTHVDELVFELRNPELTAEKVREEEKNGSSGH